MEGRAGGIWSTDDDLQSLQPLEPARHLVWQRIFATVVAAADIPEDLAIDSTHVKAHRSAAGGKGGRKFKPSGDRVAAARPRSMP